VAVDSALKSTAVVESTLEVLASGGYEIAGGRLVRRAIGRERWRQSDDDKSGIAFASAPLAELAAALRIAPTARVVAGVPMARPQAIALPLINPFLTLLLRIPAIRQVLARTGGHAATAAKAAYVSRVWVDAQAGKQKMTAQLVGGEGFSTAADIALHAVEKALVARPKPGAHTPATAFGPEFIAGIPGIVVKFTQSGSAGPPRFF